MNLRVLFSLLLLASVLPVFAQHSVSRPGKNSYAAGRVLIKLKAEPGRGGSAAEALQRLQQQGIQNVDRLFSKKLPSGKHAENATIAGLDRWHVATIPVVMDVEALAERLRQNPSIETVMPDYEETLDATPNDPLVGAQPHLEQVKATAAWEVQKGDTAVIIAIIDTGVDWDHPDLADAIWTNADEFPGNGIDDDMNGFIDDVRGWDFVKGLTGGTTSTAPDPNDDLTIADNDPMDYHGHGTHVSGIAAAVTNNGLGVASLSWGCRIMPLRIGFRTNGGGGSGYSSWMADAFVYAANNGATVANLSYSASGQLLVDAAQYAFLNGVVVCKAGGNGNNDVADLLSEQPWVMTVASVDDLDRKATYSSFGTWIKIAAPGGDNSNGRPSILSTIVTPSSFYTGSEYVGMNGTSMATPMVASLVGLLKSKESAASPAELMFQVCATADDISVTNLAYLGRLGSGRINAWRALTEDPQPMAPAISIVGVQFDDRAGNNNGLIEPGETIDLFVTLKNTWENGTNVSMTVSTNDTGTTILRATAPIGTILGIRDLAHSSQSNATDPFRFQVGNDSTPRMVNLSLLVTADQGYSRSFDLKVGILPCLLYVDDDDGRANVEQYYADAIASLGHGSYVHWDCSRSGSPSAAYLKLFHTVVWGCEWITALDSEERAALSMYLDSGRNLFIAGQDIGWNLSSPGSLNYQQSSGASKTFYETYLKSEFISDSLAFLQAKGVSGHPISGGLSFAIAEPLRAITQQYPDLLLPVGGGTPLFLYPNDNTAAVIYNGPYRLINFGFGGLESITLRETRNLIFQRCYRWLAEYTLDHTPLRDTESSQPYKVTATVTSEDSVLFVSLVWGINGEIPRTKVPMTHLGGGVYEGYIPGQIERQVSYYMIPYTAHGSLPCPEYRFNVSSDSQAPTITAADSLGDMLSRSGVIPFGFTAVDNGMIDTQHAYVHYSVNSSRVDSVSLLSLPGNRYAGLVDVRSAVGVLNPMDTVTYYYSVRDASGAAHWTRFPKEGTWQFVIGRELIDDFEKVRPIWNMGQWGLVGRIRSGTPTMTMSDSPLTWYQAYANNTLTLTSSIDVTGYSHARLYFLHYTVIDPSDTLYIECQSGSGGWTTLKTLNGILPVPVWVADSIDLPSGNMLRLRFRLHADGALQNNGTFLDNLAVACDPFITTVNFESEGRIPTNSSLEQNFPNPFNPSTVVSYQLSVASRVDLRVFDLLGREVAVLVNEEKPPGTYTVTWNADGMTSGIYFCRMQAGGEVFVRKMTLIR